MWRLGIGFVFQLIDCLSNLSAYENMEIEQPTDGVTHGEQTSAGYISRMYFYVILSTFSLLMSFSHVNILMCVCNLFMFIYLRFLIYIYIYIYICMCVCLYIDLLYIYIYIYIYIYAFYLIFI